VEVKEYYNITMASYKTTKIIPIALVLIIVAIAIAGLVSLARAVFFSGNTDTTISQSDIAKEALLSSDPEHQVILTVRGPLVADEAFRSYQIKINAGVRQITTYSGYANNQIGKVSLGNNVKAYEQFVFALYKANLVKGTEFTGDKNDLRGVCATGYVYNFEVFAHDKDTRQLWTSTCSGSKGSLDADLDQLMSLFTAQIPESENLISQIW